MIERFKNGGGSNAIFLEKHTGAHYRRIVSVFLTALPFSPPESFSELILTIYIRIFIYFT